MPSITMTVSMCAALYLIYSGENRRSVLTNKYGIPKSAIRALRRKDLIKGEKRSKYTIFHLTPLGRDVVEANLDTLKKALEVMMACKEGASAVACFEVKHARIDVPIPI